MLEVRARPGVADLLDDRLSESVGAPVPVPVEVLVVRVLLAQELAVADTGVLVRPDPGAVVDILPAGPRPTDGVSTSPAAVPCHGAREIALWR